MLESQGVANHSYGFLVSGSLARPAAERATDFSHLALLLVACIFAFTFWSCQRPLLPLGAPPLWKADDWPVLGALFYFQRPNSMIVAATKATLGKGSRSGAFSLFLGQKHVVSIGDTPEAKKVFFENKHISLLEGTAELLTALPLTKGDLERFGGFFLKTLNSFLRHENLVRILPRLSNDAHDMCLALASTNPTVEHPEWRVMNPFNDIYRCIYQLTMRVFSADEVAEDHDLGDYTLAIFHSLQRRNSTPKVYVPWLPVPGHYMRMWDGFRLYRVFRRILQHRKKSGEVREDSFQTLVDSGASAKDITGFVLNALFGGQVSTGVNAGWMPVFLSCTPDWKERAIAEVDQVISRHRASPAQRPADILGSLPLNAWQSDFPVLADYCLRESARLTMRGVLVRKNTSGADVMLGEREDGTTDIVPDGAFAIYHPLLAHFDPEVYHEPHRFNPGRYEQHCAEDKKAPFVYVGWGAGRHPCVGARFAKLEITIVLAYFLAHFDFELSDKSGAPLAKPPPLPDFNAYETRTPDTTIYLRYRPRSWAF